MTIANLTRRGWLGAALLCSALGSGCGATTEAGGVARTDVPIAGTVTLRDSSSPAQERQATSGSDGGFSVDMAGLTPPYLLKVEWGGAAGTSRLYAVADGNANLDVNPISDVTYAGAADGADEETLFRSADAAAKGAIALKARAVLTKLASALAPLFEKYGIADPSADKGAVRRLLGDVTVKRQGGQVTIANRATRGVIYTGPIANPQSGTFDRSQLPDGSTPGTCTAFTYSTWGACQSNNTQTRTVLTSTPTGCTGGNPVTSQACTYQPPAITCTSFTYSPWGACQSNNTQTRTVTASLPSGCTGGAPVTSQSCTYVPPGLDGAALYASKCASCHGPLASSEKRGRTAAQIQGKHGTRYGTTAEYEAIAKALQ